jgi:hypothetical protein
MRYSMRIYQTNLPTFIAVASLLFVVLCVGGCFPFLSRDDDDDDDNSGGWDAGTTATTWDETWILSNLFDGQTAVPPDYEIQIAVGYRDFLEDPSFPVTEEVRQLTETALSRIELLKADDPSRKIQLRFTIFTGHTLINHDGFDEDTDYILDVAGIETDLRVNRIIPYEIGFSTARRPQVTGIWKNDSTLIVSFSEPIDGETLTIAQQSFDVLWEDDNDIVSIASDLNLADFTWATDGHLFMLAPISFLSAGWVKITGDIRGLSGAYLDGNRNGILGEADDDFVEEVIFSSLPTCYARDDIPDPCLADDEIEYF